ncbi:MAG TPA: alpha-amylase family glycosyl hydrolase [Anaerolineaceae bacterium]|nr:alpha-amylase family glycosyl hydrolase [Anaerolineaceae bacterium]
MDSKIQPQPSSTLLDPAQRSLERLFPRLDARFADYCADHPEEWQAFHDRLARHFKRLFDLLLPLYGGQYDFFYHLEELLASLAQSWIDRPAQLKALDLRREQDATWFQTSQMLGGVCYVDRFAGNLEGVRRRIPYFKELGLTYLHLMPLFCSPKPENDGGYAISSYREVDPALGSVEDLVGLASELRENGISLVLDFVFNHTSDEHEWAQKAREGDPDYQAYYRMFPTREQPDAYERTLREIFPDEHPGAFTYFPEMKRWVWTTFHSYQWDLNYDNPEVFNAMVREMLALANLGVEILRLDAVAFIWKRMGTACENLPEAHQLIQAFNVAARIAAPALLFKSEAIVHPDEVARYIHPEECQLSYNPLLMALLWETLATREVRLLAASLRDRFKIPPDCAWVNYVRCHDDIGWTFSDEDAAKLGINGYDHRRFLNDFYTGRFKGSFARGLPFQENPKTGDCRISGTCASLAGLEKALREPDVDPGGPAEVELAIARILLLHGVILLIGGIPLLYLGDEIGTLNDYSFRDDPALARDSRWVHRPITDWARLELRHDPGTLEGRIYAGLQRLIALRKDHPVFSGGQTQIIDSGNPHVLAFAHAHANQRALVFANFSEQEQALPGNLLRIYGLGHEFQELISGEAVGLQDFALRPYQMMVFLAR